MKRCGNCRRPLWLAEKAIEAVQGFHERHERIPTQPEFRKKNGLPSSSWVQTHFGGLAKLVEAAGFQPNVKGGSHSRRKRAAMPPPVAAPAVGKNPAPSSVPDRTEDGPGPVSLVDAAQRVSDLTERRRALLAHLDAIEVELRDALGACQDALQAHELEDAA